MNIPTEETVGQEKIGVFGRIMLRVGEHYQNIMDNISERADKWETASILILHKIREGEDEYRNTHSDAGWIYMIESEIALANLYAGKKRYILLTEILNTLVKSSKKELQ